MYVHLAVLKETRLHEKRVAVVPAVAKLLVKLGAKVRMQTGAGTAANFSDEKFQDVEFVEDRKELVKDADVVVSLQPPAIELVRSMKDGAVLLSFIYTENEPVLVQCLLDKKITCFAMERIPRITRAQSMDALSSQSALAGYYAVGLGFTNLERVIPKITTAAGTLGPARVLVLGLGVAGLEAIATAHRLGAVVEAYDVRPATKEQAMSLGAQFIDTNIDASSKGGYARELTAEEKAKVEKILTVHIQNADLIITTASIPGKKSPKLISHEQVLEMKSGSVIVDLSAEGGGNCVDTIAGKTVLVGKTKIVAPVNVPSLLAEDASFVYSRNQYHFLALIIKDNVIKINWDDEVLANSCITHQGVSKNGAMKSKISNGLETGV